MHEILHHTSTSRSLRRWIAGVAWGALSLGPLALTLAAQQPAAQPAETSELENPPPAELTLQDALVQALRSSREIALARIRTSVAAREANLTRAKFRPNLFTGSGITYTSGIPETPGGTAPSVFNVAYIQTLFNPPLRGQLRAADRATQIEELETRRVRDSVIVKVASTYLELKKVRHALTLLRQEGASATRVLDITRQRVAEGQELSIEVTRAELDSARFEQRRLQLESREDILEAALRDLCGISRRRHVELVEPGKMPALTGITDRPERELIAMGLDSSLQVRQAELDLRAKQERLKGEKGGYYPTVDLVGKYSVLSKINNYQDFFNTFQRNNVNIGVQINIPIFSARTTAAVDLAREDLHRSELELAATRSHVEADIRQQSRRVRETEAAREVARLELKLVQEELHILQAQYEEGRAALRDIEKKRLEESTKWLAFLDADYDGQQASLELLRMTGQLSAVLQ